MIKYLLLACVAATVLLCPAFADAQQPPAVIIEENASLASGIKYQKWNVREITEVFAEKDFNGTIITVLQPGDLVWGVAGDVHSSIVGKIVVTHDTRPVTVNGCQKGTLFIHYILLGMVFLNFGTKVMCYQTACLILEVYFRMVK